MNINLILALFGVFTFTVINSVAQENRFFMPAEIRKAYENGTRSYDGTPGVNYWQNTVNYKIQVTIDPQEKLVKGYEEVVYFNNSPNEINTLVIRLYGDVFKKGNIRAYPVNEKDIDEGVELENIIIEGLAYDLQDQKMTRRSGTNISFTLQKPLKPGSELSFKTSWKQKIPAYSRIRTGAYDSTTFFIAYWYPQIAVYDDIFGWDNLDYTLRTEFYNNLCNFDVEITVPDEFIVWATGTLENADQILPEHILDKYQKARSSEEVIHIISVKDLDNGYKSLNHTWHYLASEVSDFAFAMSDHYLWDAAIQPVADRQVFISSAYPQDTSRDYSDHVAIQQKTMRHFSEDIPGIPYPYEAFTTFITMGRGGGMEYPMMANNGSPGRGVTIHEMFHTYFPMYVRVNERRWAWMDEGWATYNTTLVSNRFFNDDYETADVYSDIGSSSSIMGTIADLPLITSSEFLGNSNYGQASYSLPATVYAMLHQHLGDELFLKCYREYIKRWAKKSPTPYDFFNILENVSGKDLGWLWKPWFFDFGPADLAIQSFENNELVVMNHGNRPVPIVAEINYKNGESKFISQDAGIWNGGKNEVRLTIPEDENIDRISLNMMVPDANLVDNFFPSIRTLYKNIKISAEITGQYKSEDSPANISIIMEDGIMYYRWGDFGISQMLYPKDSVNFYSVDGTMDLKFNLDDSGSCTGVEINWRNRMMHGEKIN
ncbi:MAG: hypothetical protein AMS27_02970 [Bacteroides sp. SM23_62_1]|nr:MAG: hypothetical protein AMS27_02970 [Bacteroides sp. SM23_62_1]